MSEYTTVQKDYAQYRLDKSKEDLEAAHLLFDNGSYRVANNRACYAIFHALRAVLVFDNFDSSKHSGIIAEFGSHFQFQSKQIGTHHAGREPGFRAKNRVTFLHNGIRQGKIEIPELHDIVPGAFWKHKGIRIKFKELGYESILIGGAAAGICR